MKIRWRALFPSTRSERRAGLFLRVPEIGPRLKEDKTGPRSPGRACRSVPVLPSTHKGDKACSENISHREALSYALLETVRLLLESQEHKIEDRDSGSGHESQFEAGVLVPSSSDDDSDVPSDSFPLSHPAKKRLASGILGGPCNHCAATRSPQWRRPLTRNILLCNACGIYYSRHHSLPKRTSKQAAAQEPSQPTLSDTWELDASPGFKAAEDGLELSNSDASIPQTLNRMDVERLVSSAYSASDMGYPALAIFPGVMASQPLKHMSPLSGSTSLSGGHAFSQSRNRKRAAAEPATPADLLPAQRMRMTNEGCVLLPVCVSRGPPTRRV
eukprot:gene17974-24379_t